MKRGLRLIVLFLLLCAVAIGSLVYWSYSGSPIAKYRALIRLGRADNQYVREMERLYPNAQHSVQYFTGTHGAPTWNTKAGLYGRYILYLEIPVSMSDDVSKSRFGEPRFSLREISRISKLPDGRVVTEGRGKTMTFGHSEWKALVENGGNLAAIGVNLDGKAPIPGFEEAWPDL